MPFGFPERKSFKPGSLSRGVSNARKTNRLGLIGKGSLRVGESSRLGIIHNVLPYLSISQLTFPQSN